MKPEQSWLIKEATRRTNQTPSTNDNDEISERLEKALYDVINEHVKIQLAGKSVIASRTEIVKQRVTSVQNATRDSEIKNITRSINYLDHAVAEAAHINEVAHDYIREHFRTLGTIQPAPYSPEGSAGGEHVRLLVLLGCHALACTSASEVAYLLRAGYVDGATARSRSLYEALVIMTLLCMTNDPDISERLHATAAMEELKRARRHDADAHVLGLEKTPEDEMDELVRLTSAIKQYYDDKIAQSYEWARPLLSSLPVNKRITFADLEEAAEASSFRATYIKLNHYVHIGAASIIGSIDLADNQIYHTGPRIIGQVADDTAYCSVIWLSFISDIFFRKICWATENYDEYVLIGYLQTLSREFSEEFS